MPKSERINRLSASVLRVPKTARIDVYVIPWYKALDTHVSDEQPNAEEIMVASCDPEPKDTYQGVGTWCLDLLPPEEADIIEQVMAGRTQQEIATVFGVTQASVSARISRATWRLRWVLNPIRTSFTPEEWLRDARDVNYRNLGRGGKTLRSWHPEVLAEWWRTTWQAAACEELGINQARACDIIRQFMRHHLPRLIELEPNGPWQKYLTGFKALLKQGCVLHEVKNKHWQETKARNLENLKLGVVRAPNPSVYVPRERSYTAQPSYPKHRQVGTPDQMEW